LFVSKERRDAEQNLGWHPEVLATRFQGHSTRATVPPRSAEFRDIETIFKAEPADGVKRFYFPNRDCQHMQITKIERVQNRALKDAVDNQRGLGKSMIESMGAKYEAGVHCRWLFHGARSAESLDSIIENPLTGFAPQMGLGLGVVNLWGYGTSFALHASYSVNAGYCHDYLDEDQDCMILLCLVDTGLSCVGEEHMRILPRMHPVNKRVTYLSYIDSASSPEIFVTMGDQAYPAYIIHFSQVV
jgi:hypothetical protein